MAYAQLKTDIAAVIRNNGNQEITGNVLQGALLEMINALGANYQYAGVADTSTTITTTEANVFYLLTEAGTYSNMSSSIVHASGIGIALWNGSAWSYQNVPSSAVIYADATPTANSTNPVQSGVVYDELNGHTYNHLRGYYVSSGGAYIANTNYFSSDYIPVKTGDTIVWTVSNEAAGANLYLCYYNADKVKIGEYQYITSANYTKTLQITTADVAYLRATFLTGKEDYASISVNGKVVWTPLPKTSGISEKIGSLQDFVGLAENHIAPYCNFVGDVRYNVNGTIASAASTVVFFLEEEYIPVRFGDKIEWKFDNAANTSCICCMYDAEKGYLQGFAGTSSTGVKTMMCQRYDTYYMRFSFSRNVLDSAYVKVNDIIVYKPQIRTNQTNAIIPFSHIANYKECAFIARNGSQGNPGNPDIITLKGNNSIGLVIPCTYGHKYKIVINRPNASGCVYCYAYYTYSTLTPSALYTDVIHKDDTHKTPIGQLLEITDTNAVAMTITIAERVGNENGAYNPIRIADFDFQTMGDIRILDVTETITEQIRPLLPTIEELADNGIISRNEDKLPMLVNSCRFRKTNASPYKDWQGVICTDSHGDTQAVNNAIDASEGIDYIDCILHLGDYAASYYTAAMVANYQSQVERCTKPWYFCVGNHDVGNGYYVGLCCDHTQAYNSFIAPLITAGFITDTNGKCYWYKDLTEYKLRIICLYEYDDPMDFDETYWKAITYDSTLANIAPSTTYSVGQKVNVGKFGNYGEAYTAHSFECVQGCTTSTTPYNSASVLPKYKIRRGDRVIRQTQAQWFLDTLASTPANYGVVLLTHNPYGKTIKAQDVRFNYIAGTLGSSAAQDAMSTNFIQDALAAFKAGSNYSANVAMKGDAAYMNTQGGNTYAYSVSKNFASKNSGVYVACVLGGHVHSDKVYKDETAIIYQINPICATRDIANATNQDIRRTDADGLCYDSLTVVSTAQNRIGLTKLGVNVTENGVKRDYEVIDTSV